jgi:hypothetical protein
VTQRGLFTGNLLDEFGFLNSGLPGSPDTFRRRNLPRVGLVDSAGDSGHVALTDAVMTSTPLFLAENELVTNLSFLSGATAVNTPAHWWFALYSDAATPALISQSADATTEAWAANTWKTKALGTPYRVPRSGVYWAAIMQDATAVGSLIGAIGARALLSGERNLAQTSGSALAATAPATIATPTAQSFVPLVVAS